MPSHPIRCAAVAAFLAVTALQAGAQAQDASCQNPQTQADMNRCAGAGHAAQDKKLNQSTPPTARGCRRRRRSNWPRRRKKPGSRFGTPTAASSRPALPAARPAAWWVLNGCLEDKTRQRVKELEALAACKEGDLACPAPN